MSCNNHSVAFFLAVLVLFSAANPLAAQGGLTLGFGVRGRVFCSPTGNWSGGEGLAGAEVRLNITDNRSGGVSATAGRNTTDGSGLFYIYIGAQSGTTVANLNVSVGLPITNCPPLSAINGELVAPVKYVRTQIYKSEGRVVVYGTVGYFTVRKY